MILLIREASSKGVSLSEIVVIRLSSPSSRKSYQHFLSASSQFPAPRCGMATNAALLFCAVAVSLAISHLKMLVAQCRSVAHDIDDFGGLPLVAGPHFYHGSIRSQQDSIQTMIDLALLFDVIQAKIRDKLLKV